MVRQHTEAAVEGARHGYRVIRSELAGQLPTQDIEAVLDAYRIEGTKLAPAARASVPVERALRGEVFSLNSEPLV